MEDDWSAYRGAPPEETVLARTRDLPDGTALSLSIDSGAGGFPILLIASRGLVRAFVNACPHRDLPLDYRGPQVLSTDGARLRCTVHEAVFRLEDGVGIEGPGTGCRLDGIPVAVDPDGTIRIRRPTRPDQG